MKPAILPQSVVLAIILSAVALVSTGLSAEPAEKPNIVLILADDLGYGDVGCYGASRVKTPNLDRMAEEGLRFTDGHSTSATCTPSRYSLLTGEYAWRRQGTGILPGNAAMIIEPGRPTLPGVLRQAGYTTGAVGKWHLGLGAGDLDWNGDIKPGPLEIGFDYAFLIPATGDRVPCVYVENHRVVGLDPGDPIRVSYTDKIGNEPTGRENPELLKVKPSHGHDATIVNGISRIGFMSGGQSARWKDEDMADAITARAVKFIERSAERPFFLYFATHDIHVPRVPHPRFTGTSGCGVRGDVIQQLDWCVGEILTTLKRLNLDERTMVIFTSDNGPVVDDGYADGAVEDLNDHAPAGPLRGSKYTFYEGGTRVPFIARWPGQIKPGVSEALVCQVDLLASCAALAGAQPPVGAGPDSVDVLPALLGESQTGREQLVEHAGRLALRRGMWKLVPGGGNRPAQAKTAGKGPELYDLENDLGETANVAGDHPDQVKKLGAELNRIRAAGARE